MALIRCDHFSDLLQQGMSLVVVLPEPAQEQIGVAAVADDRPPPVLYLLHGLSDDATAWTRNTSIERYAAERGLAVVMPQVHRSFYTDLLDGHGAYWRYLAEEVPATVQRFFRVSDRREDTFVAGLSMGGFGAVKWASAEPSRFAAAASMSGALDLPQLIALGDREDLFHTVLGGRTVSESGNDLFTAVAGLDPDTAPRFHVSCGTDDVRLLPGNRRMVAHLEALGLEVTSPFSPGDHVWSYWDARIQDVVA